SILLSTIGFGGLLYGFNMLQESGWNDAGTVIGLIAGAVALILFVLRQFRLQIPIVELRVLKVPLFTLVTVVSILSFSFLISIDTILPMFFHNAELLSAIFGGLFV